MRHLTEDELVLHHFGETAGSPAGAHFAGCAECRARLDGIASDLALFDRLPVPERGETYGREVWQKLRRRLAEEAAPRRAAFAWRLWVLSGSLAALLAVAFLAGRLWPRPAGPASIVSSESRERVLLYAVADHLDRSQIALLEFLHSDGSSAEEASRERSFAEELVSANRLYRQTAANSGENGVAGVLDDLERVLLQIAHAPSPEARQALQRRIESEGTLFKIRVVRSQLGKRQKAASPPASARS
jgi:hypothetical protein